jgi:thioredoxin-like negative regulator of GroEL
VKPQQNVQLLVAGWYEPCRESERVWREVAAERGVQLAVLDVDLPEGEALATRLDIKALPAVLLDGRLVAIGVQDRAQAIEILEATN